jgi:hypothetical protein
MCSRNAVGKHDPGTAHRVLQRRRCASTGPLNQIPGCTFPIAGTTSAGTRYRRKTPLLIQMSVTRVENTHRSIAYEFKWLHVMSSHSRQVLI